jgi:HSP20 family protein
MNRMMEETLDEATPTEREMVLAVNVLADDEAYTISALVPGMEADDLEIEILNNTVTIRGEFKCADPEKVERTEADHAAGTGFVPNKQKYLLCELPAGSFSRLITLPTAVDAAKTEANIKNGVLSLHVPKAEAHRPRAIKVKTE